MRRREGKLKPEYRDEGSATISTFVRAKDGRQRHVAVLVLEMYRYGFWYSGIEIRGRDGNVVVSFLVI